MEASVAVGAHSSALRHPEWHPVTASLLDTASLEEAQPHRQDRRGQAGESGAPRLLETKLDFVRSQHADMMLALRTEIDRLRQENNDLQYRLIMASRSSLRGQPEASGNEQEQQQQQQQQNNRTLATPRPDASWGDTQAADAESSRDSLMRELARVQQLLDGETRHRLALQSALERLQAEDERPSGDHPSQPAVHSAITSHQPERPQASPAAAVPMLQLADNRILLFNPLRIISTTASATATRPHLPTDASSADGASPPSLAECQAVIRRLAADNVRQAAEIDRLKAAAATAAAARRAANQQQQQQQPGLPSLLLRPNTQQPHPRHQHLHRSQLHQQLLAASEEALSRLPALTSALGTRAAELQRRRAQIVRGGHQPGGLTPRR